jgi:hypothetical protein
MWIRGLPARWLRKTTSPPTRLLLAEGTGLPGWLLLGERPDPRNRLWRSRQVLATHIEWRDVPQAEFGDFTEPGWGKIAANFSVVPYGENTLLGYECRTVTTDLESRRRFRRYWWLIRPFVGHIMRATLAKVKADAEAATNTQPPLG